METGWLILASALAVAGSLVGWRGLKSGQGHAFWWMAAVFVCQLFFLQWRGELRGRCPLQDIGEIAAFLAWSLTFFYLVTGPGYRVSLLGMFTAPLVVLFQIVALWPGAMSQEVVKATEINPWAEAHAAFSVLSYGALALSAVAGVMFLVLNRRLKAHEFKGGLTKGMPSVHRLVGVMGRLAVIGWGILTVGVVTGFMMEGGAWSRHLVLALVVWLAYALLLGVFYFRGMPPRWMAWLLVALFAVSLFVFGKIS
ncbi:MAG: cytochrome c biogenesis protein CcsA [Verrucomicrobiales bacterium]